MNSNENSKTIYYEIKNADDLDYISNYYPLIENPITGRFGSKSKDYVWSDIKSFIALKEEKIIDFTRRFSFFAITGSAGSGKSTILFKNIDDYIKSKVKDRRVLLLDPDNIINVINDFIEEKSFDKFLFVVDSFNRDNNIKKVISMFMSLHKFLFYSAIDAKVVFSISDNCWHDVVTEFETVMYKNISTHSYELKTHDAWDINDVYEKILSFYKSYDIVFEIPDLKSTILRNAINNPSLIRYQFEQIYQNIKLENPSNLYVLSHGIHNSIWKEISDLKNSDSKGVKTLIMLLWKFPSLRLSRDSVLSILINSNMEEVEETLVYLWGYFLVDDPRNKNFKNLASNTRDSIDKVMQNKAVLTEKYLREFSIKYCDFYNKEFIEILKLLFLNYKEIISASTFESNSTIWKAIELLLIDNKTETLDFISDAYSTQMKSDLNFGSEIVELDKLLNHHIQGKIWEIQTTVVKTDDFLFNQNKQMRVFEIFKKYVDKIYFKNKFKLHDYANQLRRFCLPAFEESSAHYNELQNTILKWYEKSNESVNEMMAYQGIAKFYLDIKNFDRALDYIDRGIDSNEGRNNFYLISLFQLKAQILFDQADILYYKRDETFFITYNMARSTIEDCNKLIDKYYSFSLLKQSVDSRLKHSVRCFYTYYSQFIDKSQRFRGLNFPSYPDIFDVITKLDFSLKYLPPHKDTLAASVQFRINNFSKLGNSSKISEFVNEASTELLKRYLNYKEPKIRDIIKDLSKFAKEHNIKTIEEEEVNAILKERIKIPHISRSIRGKIEDLEQAMTKNLFSKDHFNEINQLVQQPFNSSTAQNLIRLSLLKYIAQVKYNIDTEEIKSLLHTYIYSSIYCKSYFTRTYISMFNKLKDSKFFSSKEFVTAFGSFIDFFPGEDTKNDFRRELNQKYKEWAKQVNYDRILEGNEKKIILNEIVENWRLIGGQNTLDIEKYENILKKFRNKRV